MNVLCSVHNLHLRDLLPTLPSVLQCIIKKKKKKNISVIYTKFNSRGKENSATNLSWENIYIFCSFVDSDLHTHWMFINKMYYFCIPYWGNRTLLYIVFALSRFHNKYNHHEILCFLFDITRRCFCKWWKCQ